MDIVLPLNGCGGCFEMNDYEAKKDCCIFELLVSILLYIHYNMYMYIHCIYISKFGPVHTMSNFNFESSHEI